MHTRQTRVGTGLGVGRRAAAPRWKAEGRLAVRFGWLYYTNHGLKVRRTEKSRGGETGRLAALKTRCPRGRRGSNPLPGTTRISFRSQLVLTPLDQPPARPQVAANP